MFDLPELSSKAIQRVVAAAACVAAACVGVVVAALAGRLQAA
jgi:hypothetical protein